MARLDTRTLIEGALVIALAAALNALGPMLPQGGRVSLVMLPLVVYGVRRGPVAGLIAGSLFGLVDLLIEPVGVFMPIQILLDYPVAFGMAGMVAGLFAGAWRAASARGTAAMVWVAVIATLAATGARFAAHWLSGLIFFGSFAPPGQPAWLYSLLYNGAYLLPTAILSAILAAVVLPALQRIPVRATRTVADGS
jgi:thiamine transporter